MTSAQLPDPASRRPPRPAPRPEDVRLVALDLDGTTCLPGGRMGPRCGEAIRALHRRGVHVVFATGRSAGSTRRLHAELDVAAPAITLNGSFITDPSGDTWHHRPLPAPLTAGARALLEAEGMVVVQIVEDALFHLPDHAWTRHNLGIWEFREGATGPWPAEATVLFAIGDAASARAGAVALRGRFDPDVSLFEYPTMAGTSHHVEVRARGDDKGAALLHVSDRLGVAREQTLAIGDWFNDVSLLEQAGYGVAMAHAPPELRAVADVVTRTSNHAEGAADFLETFFGL